MQKLNKKTIFAIACLSLSAVMMIVVLVMVLGGNNDGNQNTQEDPMNNSTLKNLARTTAVYYIQDGLMPEALSDFLQTLDRYEKIDVTIIDPDATPLLLEALNEDGDHVSAGDMVIKYAGKNTEIISAQELLNGTEFTGGDYILEIIGRLANS